MRDVCYEGCLRLPADLHMHSLQNVYFRGSLSIFPYVFECFFAKNRPEMTSFSNLPTDIVLEIFEYLPFKDRIRAGRVSQLFHEMSRLTVSKTKTINLGDRLFNRLTPGGLASLVDLCKNNLESVTLESFTLPRKQLAAAFSTFSCPNLVALDMGYLDCGANIFGALVANNQNLQSLIWRDGMEQLKYPRGVVSENLRELELGDCVDATFDNLSGRCPNLRKLSVYSLILHNGKVFDRFFAHSSLIEYIYIKELCGVTFGSLKNFWRLASLSSFKSRLDFGGISTNNKFLIKVSESFPQLQKLSLPLMNITSAGIRALAALPNLRTLKVNCDENEVDDGIVKVAQRRKLEELIIVGGVMWPETFIALLRFCPNLRHLCLDKVLGFAETDAFIDVIRQASSSPGREIYVEMHEGGVNQDRISEVLDEIAAAGGRRIFF